MRKITVLAVMALPVLFGCSEDIPVVEPIKRPSQSKSSDVSERVKRKKPASRERAKSGRPSPTPAVPVKTPVKADPIVLKANEMRAESGEADAEGGWKLSENGALQADIKLDFTVTGLEMDMKGDAANGVWPEVELNLWEKNTQSTYFPWGTSQNTRDFVTTSTYFNHAKAIERPIPPGEYLVTFRYYNNGSNGDEDRNAYLRRITLLP